MIQQIHSLLEDCSVSHMLQHLALNDNSIFTHDFAGLRHPSKHLFLQSLSIKLFFLFIYSYKNAFAFLKSEVIR